MKKIIIPREKFQQTLTQSIDALFLPSIEKQSRWLTWLWLLGLFLLGIFLWGKFFSWNTGPFNYHDWALVTIPRLDLMRDALSAGTLPFHAADTTTLLDVSDRFFVIPDVITTPQMVLLPFVGINTFIIIDVLLNYSIGFLGLLWLRRKKNLSLFTFTIAFLLFNFNGYILGHYSVGHFSWGGYFLFPIVFGLLFEFVEKEEVGWRWVSLFALSLFYIVLAGGEHHFLWLLLFVFPFCFTAKSWKRAKWIILACLFAGLLSAVRLIPPALALSMYQKKQNFNFVLGYPSLGHILQAMIIPTVPVESLIKPFNLNSFSENIWEFGYYVGVIGVLFILYFGIWHWYKNHLKEYGSFLLPTVFALFLALGSNYWLIRETGFPIFGSERVIARLICVPMTLLILLAAIFLQRWLDQSYQRPLLIAAGFPALLFLFNDLWENLKLWRLNEYAGYFSPETLVNIDGNSIANHADPQYFSTLALGLVISVGTFLFLMFMSWKERRSKQNLKDA